MRKKKRDEGNYYIIGATILSIVFVIGGFLIKSSRAEEVYRRGKERTEEEKKKVESDNMLFLMKKGKTLDEISFIDFKEEENKISHRDYKGNLIIKEDEKAITLKEVYARDGRVSEKIIEENFKVKNFKVVEIDMEKIETYIEGKITVDNIILASNIVEKEKRDSFKSLFKASEEIKVNEKFIKELKAENIKKEENGVKELKVEKFIDSRVFIFLSEKEKTTTFYYLDEAILKEYIPYKELKEKEEFTIRELEEKARQEAQSNIVPPQVQTNGGASSQGGTGQSGNGQGTDGQGGNGQEVKPEEVKPDTGGTEGPTEGGGNDQTGGEESGGEGTVN